MAPRDWIAELYSQGRPVQAGDWTITPISRALVIQIPGLLGGLVWNRPAYVRLVRQGEQEHLVPVHDLTRIAVVGIAVFSFIGVILARLILGKDKR